MGSFSDSKSLMKSSRFSGRTVTRNFTGLISLVAQYDVVEAADCVHPAKTSARNILRTRKRIIGFPFASALLGLLARQERLGRSLAHPGHQLLLVKILC